MATWRATGGPVYPRQGWRDGSTDWPPSDGISLRDYMATEVLKACMSGGGLADVVAGRLSAEVIAEHCYKIADAMIVQLSK